MKMRSPTAYTAYLPPSIDWLPNSQIENLLGLSPSVLRRDKSALRSLGILNIPERSKGCTVSQVSLIAEYRQLIRERGRKVAIKEIWRKYGSRKR